VGVSFTPIAVIGCGSIHARATSLLDVLELRGPISRDAEEGT
jgi:hypothetical protein